MAFDHHRRSDPVLGNPFTPPGPAFPYPGSARLERPLRRPATTATLTPSRKQGDRPRRLTMIVGTEGSQETEEIVETTSGDDTAGADARKDQTQKGSASAPAEQAAGTGGNAGSTGGSGSGGSGSGGSGSGGGGKAPADPTADIQKSIALADAMKPLEGPTADL